METTKLAERIDAYFANRDSTIARDLKLNLLRFVNESTLEPVDRALAGLATARSAGAAALVEIYESELRAGGVSDAEIQEARESAAIMAMLNTYYRFRHMVGSAAAEDYRNAGLRMTALAKPTLGKKAF
jgi:alkyl hydroperoxide reductase subunit D